MLIRAEDSISISYIGFTSAINREMTLPLMLRKLSPEAEPIILSPTDEYMLDEVSSKAYGKRLVGIPNKVAEIGKDYGGYNGAAELLLLNCDRIVEKAKENNGKCVVVIDGFEVFAKDAIKTGHQRFGHDWDQEVVEGLDPIHSKGRLNRDGINKLSGVELTVVTLVNFDKIENPYAKQYLCGIIGASGFKCTSMNI
jgi:hypothetical protein